MPIHNYYDILYARARPRVREKLTKSSSLNILGVIMRTELLFSPQSYPVYSSVHMILQTQFALPVFEALSLNYSELSIYVREATVI